MRKICYVTGTRADFGLMSNTLKNIHLNENFSLDILITGMHLLEEYGLTYKEIESTGLNVRQKVKTNLSGQTGYEMSISIGELIIGFTQAFNYDKPDIILLLGDRGEMLAAAIAALHLNIHIVHIHGGELSGTVDESIRHAISKIAHYHFVATSSSKKRLIKMGEKQENIYITGAPGLDDIYNVSLPEKKCLYTTYGLNPDRKLALVLFHPIVQKADVAGEQMQILLEAAVETGFQVLILSPNADAGGNNISKAIDEACSVFKLYKLTHLPRIEFLGFLASAELLLGNSSCGIIEAASFRVPVVNVGDRQKCRERNANVIDAPVNKKAICESINTALGMNLKNLQNVYGSGESYKAIISNLSAISLDPCVLEKTNAY